MPNGRWPLADGYEIDGLAIRPHDGADFDEYDVLGTHSPPEQRQWRSEAPYGPLLRLLGEPFDEARVTKRQQRAILDWVNQYGLLGAINETYRSVTYPPRSVAYPRPPLRTEQWTFTRDRDSWERRLTRDTEPGTEGFTLPSALPRHGGVEPLSQRWYEFFIGVARAKADSFEYPPLDTAEFWRGYQEPLTDFFTQIRRLDGALREVAEVFAGKPPSVGPPFGRLDELAGSLRVTMDVAEGGTVTEVCSAGSLIAYLAIMARRDIVAGGRPRECGRCTAMFVARSDRTTFCSDRCRTAARKARQRAVAPTGDPALGSRIKTARELIWSQEALASLIGRTQPYVSAIETGKRPVSDDELAVIATALETSVAALKGNGAEDRPRASNGSSKPGSFGEPYEVQPAFEPGLSDEE